VRVLAVVTSLSTASEMLVDKETAGTQQQQQQQQRVAEAALMRSLSSSSSPPPPTAADAAAGHALVREDHAGGSAESLVTKVSADHRAVLTQFNNGTRNSHSRSLRPL